MNFNSQRGRNETTGRYFPLSPVWIGVLFLGLCGLLPPAGAAETPAAPAAVTTGPDEAPISVDAVTAGRSQIQPPGRTPPAPPATEPGSGPAAEYPSRLIPEMTDPAKKFPVKFNYDNLPVTDIVPMFADQLKFNYLIDPAVKGAVTMTMDTELTAQEIWMLLEHLLWLNGAYASPNRGFVHILPVARMPQERGLLGTFKPEANVEVALLQGGRLKSAELQAALKPFMSEGASLTDMPRLNALLAVDTPVAMAKLRELVRRLDTNTEAAWPVKAVPCEHINADVLQEELANLLPVLGYPVTDKASNGGEVKITAVPRLQVLVISAALPEVVDEVVRWAGFLDHESETEQESLFFYNIRHNKADRLSEALGTFFNLSGGTATSASSPGKSKSISAKAGMKTTAETAAVSTAQSLGGVNRGKRETTDRKTVFDNPVTVYADTDQNRLTILTTPRTYAMIEALLKRLDVSPRQVQITANIADITLNKETQFGFTYAAAQKIRTWDVAWYANGTTGGVPTATTLPSITKDSSQGISALFRRGDNELAFIQAVAGETNVHILASPQILALNDQQAQINIGDKIPIITSDYTNVTSTGSTNRSYQYVDTGVIMTVTPHITAGNEVRMEIKQEVSQGQKNTLADGSTSDTPTIQNRVLETQCVVPDGATIIMGGLIKTNKERSHSGIPLLKDIPYLGFLFKTNDLKDDRSELLVTLTVHVMKPDDELDRLASRYQLALKDIREKKKP